MAEGRVGGDRKVLVPAESPAVLPRAAVESRLEEARDRRLTLVTAASGMGKTTLLAGWARRRGCAWYTVGPEDRDPAVFARGLLEAARRRVPALEPAAVTPAQRGEGLAVPFEGQGALAADQVLAVLGDHLHGDLTLVLDDLHELDGSDASCRFLGDLVRAAPATLHLVLSSRTDPPFGVARLRV